jgi:hypothetical protein
MNYWFPVAYAVNSFAMTLMLISLGLAGRSELAAEVGIVQGATLALFYALSANARNLILNPASPVSTRFILRGRLLLMVPLAAISLGLAAPLGGAEQGLAVALIMRRCMEWLSEVYLGEMERTRAQGSAKWFLLRECASFILVLAWVLSNAPMPLLAWYAWALLPALVNIRFVQGAIRISEKAAASWRILAPHFGSTAIIGVTVYVFRLLILSLTGKETAGDLYTAFAIGGFPGSVFAVALGPSIVLHEQRSGRVYFPWYLKSVSLLSLGLGAAFSLGSLFAPNLLGWTGKSAFFWGAMGLSLIGGVIMVQAQRVRLRLLQHHEHKDVFGPDVLQNILVVASVPFSYYLLGEPALTALYLWSAVLALVFYSSSERAPSPTHLLSFLSAGRLKALIAAALLFPLFLQMRGGIFRSPEFIFDSGGMLARLPIPLSVLACYGGIVLLGEYRKARLSLAFIFFTCLLMLAAAILTTSGDTGQAQAKLILLVQFVLPMFALVLGQLYADPEGVLSGFEKPFLHVLAVLIPVQLVLSWAQGYLLLYPYLYLFSVYQHMQYVPVIMCCAYLVALCGLWDLSHCRKILLVLAPVLALYAAASLSMSAMFALITGVIGFAIMRWRVKRDRIPAVMTLVVAVSAVAYVGYAREHMSWKYPLLEGTSTTGTRNLNEIAPNMNERIGYWKFYGAGIASGPRAFLLGHAERPERTRYPSAHNYYLDFVYNFGALAMFPFLALIAYTLAMILMRRQAVIASEGLLGLAAVVLFLVLLDNSLKVGLRQPYPGIFTFFLWGVLLSRLRSFASIQPRTAKA